MTTDITHGADTDQLRRIAEALTHTAHDLGVVEQTGTTQLATLLDAWLGPDTDQFASDWHTAAPQLATAADRLTLFARQLHEHANEQDHASTGTSSGTGARPPAGPGRHTPDSPNGPDLRATQRGLDVPKLTWPDARTALAGLPLPDGSPIDWWKKGVRFAVKSGLAFPNVPSAPIIGPLLLKSYDRWQETDLTWFEGLFVPWMWPEAWRNKYLDAVDDATDWANDLYKDHARDLPGIKTTRWATNTASNLLDAATPYVDKAAPYIPFGHAITYGLNTTNDTLKDTTNLIDDPKAWWDQASGLDQAGVAATVVPGIGFIGKAATKTTKEVIDLLSKVNRATPNTPSSPTPPPVRTPGDTPDPTSPGDKTPGGTPDTTPGDKPTPDDPHSPDSPAPGGGTINDLHNNANNPDPTDDLSPHKQHLATKALGILDDNNVTDLDQVWDDVRPLDRGYVLEATEGGNLPPNYPTIDRIERTDDGVDITSIKSLDPQAKSYQGSRFTRTINEYVDSVADFNGKDHGGVEVTAREIDHRTLDLIIRPDSLTPAQTERLDRAIERAESKGVKLVVKERP